MWLAFGASDRNKGRGPRAQGQGYVVVRLAPALWSWRVRAEETGEVTEVIAVDSSFSGGPRRPHHESAARLGDK
jgi:hypothetical protein